MYYVSIKSYEEQKEDLQGVAVKLIDNEGKVIINKKNAPSIPVKIKSFRYKSKY